MIINDNIDELKHRNPGLKWEAYLRDIKLQQSNINVEQTKSGFPTLIVKAGEKSIFIHSKYNPEKEAELLINKYEDITEYGHVLFYGVGLGYHIEYFNNKYPDIEISIYEPNGQIFFSYLTARIIKDSMAASLKHVFVPGLTDNIDVDLGGVLSNLNNRTLIIVLPSYESAFQEEYKEFYERYGRFFNTDAIVSKTRQVFEKTWLTNVVLNFGSTLNSSNILYEGRKYFEGRPAVLVSAGPSLNEEIENLRYIKENGAAYIFAAGSSINTLVKYDVLPDAAIAIDPSDYNYLVIKTLSENGSNSVTLICGTGVGYNTLSSYSGRKIHFTTNKDSVAPVYLKFKGDRELEIIDEASSVAVVALDLLNRLGCDPIILVGQNLGFKGGNYYAKGIDYSIYGLPNDNEKQSEYSFIVPGVCGENVYTNKVLNRFREDFECIIKRRNISNVINTTKGGAKISGTVYKPLNEVIEYELRRRAVEDIWEEFDIHIYDGEYLNNQSGLMKLYYQRYLNAVEKMYCILDDAYEATKTENKALIREVFKSFHESYIDITDNSFFRVFVYPMNSYQCGLLVKELKNIQIYDNPEGTLGKICSGFKAFLDKCTEDMNTILPLYNRITEIIDQTVSK